MQDPVALGKCHRPLRCVTSAVALTSSKLTSLVTQCQIILYFLKNITSHIHSTRLIEIIFSVAGFLQLKFMDLKINLNLLCFCPYHGCYCLLWSEIPQSF